MFQDEKLKFPYSPPNSGSKSEVRELPTKFPNWDGNHWFVIMYEPGGIGATEQEMMDCYVETLTKVLGSEEEAKKKIYYVSGQSLKSLGPCYYAFGCQINEETSNKLKGLPQVLFVLPDFNTRQ